MIWRRRSVLPAAVLVPLLGACAAPAPAPSGKAAPGFPYTVANCGVTTTYQAPPQRAVTMNQHVTEVMLALGLEKSLVGTAYLDDRILPAYKKAYDTVPVLAKEYPSKEALLAVNPDFVYGGYGSAFDAKAGRSRDDLKAAGVDTRLNMEYCPSGASSLSDLYREVDEVARTFGVPERAATWTTRARETVARTERTVRGERPVSVFVYDSGDKTAFTAGGKGIGNELISRAGGRNVFADLDKPFGDATWEQVVARAPEVIVIYDYGATTVEQKKKRLLEDPALKDVPAVRNRRFAVLPLSDAVLGVRVPAAVQKLAAQLHPAR
ncbi:ABC transporter substrate-binding protein [Streptomyces sp. QHH-9511]|uniref:ABC transporter substrate-binding protein n=1 Tax=Streptomyces sp. QHH-9511 TaxID=2684468 RepID=UPI001316C782|nr:ABC transporter substrate-binding protein [Streptomyces sp. QHH-9511]QGZ49144.1 ABC transporter substrate-binding protein [Streptomyces sp. QHH-9511]